MKYKEVTFEISPLDPWREILLAYLGELHYDSFVEEEKYLKNDAQLMELILQDCIKNTKEEKKL